jgi:BNR/Asp-box repeat
MNRILVGTEKGAYLLNRSGSSWGVEGPLFPGWKATGFGTAPDGTHLLAVGSGWFGVGIHRSPDLSTWEQVDQPPSWPAESGRKMEQLWTLSTFGDRVWMGTADAGLFRSEDQGITWDPVTSLNEHRTRGEWGPGGGGLCAHRILHAGDTIWVAISAVGVFRSDDGGETWHPKNDGVPAGDDAEGAERPEVGYCVHGIAHDPAQPDRMWRQDHQGMFRSTDGGDNWERNEEGLPAAFGFMIWRDNDSGRLFTFPLESSGNRVSVDGELRVYKSDDDGDSWEVAGEGWPRAPRFTGVLRGAFDGDGAGTLCFGTMGGNLWLTEDNGDHWAELESSFPRIGAVQLVG